MAVRSNGELQICGYSVFFPEGRVPFPAQYAVMSKVLRALGNGENGLLESPTGTGKTLAFLASVLSWQKAGKSVCKSESVCEGVEVSTLAKGGKSRRLPRVYFCTRTHSQVKQMVKELRSCNPVLLEHIDMCVLGGRSQSCVNKEVRRASEMKSAVKGLDELCREARMNSCLYAKQVDKLVGVLSKEKVWDIEDVLPLGRKLKGCPYYASREVHEKSANIIFAPYNYIIDASIRSSSKVCLKNSVVIFDEAHNIEDICREAGSIEITQALLSLSVGQLRAVVVAYGSVPHKELLSFVCSILEWVNSMAPEVSVACGVKASGAQGGNEFGSPLKLLEWEGPELMAIFAERLDLNAESLKKYRDLLRQIRSEDEETGRLAEDVGDVVGYEKAALGSARRKINLHFESDGVVEEVPLLGKGGVEGAVVLSVAVLTFLDRLLVIFDYMLRDKLINAPNFQIVLQKGVTHGEFRSGSRLKRGLVVEREELTLNIWCMSGGVVFREISAECHSVLLTSGTLSPLDSFAYELGSPFPVRVEASHVINVENQLLVGVVSSCGGVSLNCEYRNQDSAEYLDAVGVALYATVGLTPGGVLVFVSSYSLLDKFSNRWSDSGLLSRLEFSLGVRTFVEPRDSKVMNEVLLEYYAELDKPGGKAVMLAVCRGKVSEGINFSDHYARAVMIVGIPFPSLGDLKVKAKRQFQDEKHVSDASCLSGDVWYKQQAYRAINQAVGRCIRHKNDHGAVLLLDPRFGKSEAINYLSKWLRGRAVIYDSFGDVTVPLEQFFDGLLPADSLYRLKPEPKHCAGPVKRKVSPDWPCVSGCVSLQSKKVPSKAGSGGISAWLNSSK